MESRKMVLMNLLIVENGLVGTAEQSEGGTNWESNIDNIHCHVQNRQLLGRLGSW